MTITLINDDCLKVMKDIPDKSIDFILADLPYGITGYKWDSVIPIHLLWKEYFRIMTDTAVVALFGTEPFSSVLRTSNLKWYRYDWIWNKFSGGNFMQAKKMPIKITENISIFYKKTGQYYPIMTDSERGRNRTPRMAKTNFLTPIKSGKFMYSDDYDDSKLYPKNLINISIQSTECNNSKRFHSTQKPVDLLEYLISTYTKENDTVLDNTMGVGSTGVACVNTNRNFIGIEIEKEYFDIAKQRIYLDNNLNL
jgi:DNA modification methylase